MERLIADRFEIDQPVSAGGMGTVYRGVDRATGEPVAVKIVIVDDPVDAERFEREAAALATLSHPGIVRHVAHGATPEGERYLVMEWIDGDSLAVVLAHESISTADSVAVARQVAAALADAHDHGLVHRDIKPDNLMFSGDTLDGVRLVDFGVARSFVDDDKLTRTGHTIGTPGYMAPEQATGARDIDPRADVFALGCVLYECLAGAPPFTGENPMAIQVKVVMVDPPPLATVSPHVPPALAALVERMMAKRKDDRIATMPELVAALDALPALPDVRPPRGIAAPAVTRRVDVATGTPAVARATAPCLVLAAVPRADAGWLARARAAVQPWRAAAQELRDGVLVVVHADPIAAGRCALALARDLPEATLVVSTPAADDPAEQVIDRGTRVMSVAAVRAKIARGGGGSGGRVHVDPESARRLAAHFTIVEEGQDRLLSGERAAHG